MYTLGVSQRVADHFYEIYVLLGYSLKTPRTFLMLVRNWFNEQIRRTNAVHTPVQSGAKSNPNVEMQDKKSRTKRDEQKKHFQGAAAYQLGNTSSRTITEVKQR